MLRIFIFVFVGLIPILHVCGHGNMVTPPAWWDRHEKGAEEGRQCITGTYIMDMPAGFGTGTSCLWYTNFTFISHEPTLPESMRTFRNVVGDIYIKHPWRSPGSAPVHSPCGNAGGNPDGCPAGAPRGEGVDCFGGGWSHGPNAEDYDFQDIPVTEWAAGSVVEVAWGILANHGGGYSYRLCKLPEEGRSYLTEECFQETTLDFVGDVQWVQYGKNESTRIEFVANRTRDGTYPKGSQWTKNPIPACYPLGWPDDRKDGECYDIQFPEPAPGLSGYGTNIWSDIGWPQFRFNIVDKVQIPENLTPGDYVLSFRWDCEHTPQIWNSCSSIKLVEALKGGF